MYIDKICLALSVSKLLLFLIYPVSTAFSCGRDAKFDLLFVIDDSMTMTKQAAFVKNGELVKLSQNFPGIRMGVAYFNDEYDGCIKDRQPPFTYGVSYTMNIITKNGSTSRANWYLSFFFLGKVGPSVSLPGSTYSFFVFAIHVILYILD